MARYTIFIDSGVTPLVNISNNRKNTKTALIIGASGLVGEQLLLLLLASQHYSRVIAIVRQPLALEHNKLEQFTINFKNLDEQLNTHFAIANETNSEQLKVDHIYCTLGTTIKKAGSKEAFYQVDHNYPLTIAEHFHHRGASLFAIVSAIGANKHSAVFYNQVKGKVEANLADIGYQHLGIFQPSMLVGNRKEFRLGEYLGTIFMKLFALIIPKKYQVIEAIKVANAMMAFADKPSKEISIIQSDQMQNH
ncbi:NAD-dependent epimerase/dehydratase family protein [Cognaticolwellia mytili]|uniref:NAD-dependent epimerase/dehydratase family protein n=1 Tax=Cognaticolwellia mytili TaxID=1888913 RepID=UPI000A174D04|nr:NAD-dependent epimerase/dehydratase family protein [Cognaticolwellia mytili]